MFGIVTVLAVAELAARVVFPEWMPTRSEVNFWIYDSLLGWAHQPGQQGRLVHRDFSVPININSHGLRDDEYSPYRSPRKRMLILGDSFGWGFGVECDGRFSEIPEKMYPDWEIINASVSGYGTDQQLLFLGRNGINYEPDVELLLFCFNDFEDNSTPEQYWYYKPCFGSSKTLCNYRIRRCQARHSRKSLTDFFSDKLIFMRESIHDFRHWRAKSGKSQQHLRSPWRWANYIK